MTLISEDLDLTGKMLIAMPGMGDPRFDKSLILMCDHSPDGAMGLIVNHPTDDLKLRNLLEQLDIPQHDDVPNPTVYFGGPVETGRGFVLHSPDFTSALKSMEITGGFKLTATMDVLEEIARGMGPSQSLIALGYAGWGPGQLEGEIVQNGWLTCDATQELVFGSDNAGKWEAALNSIGAAALTLSASAGHA